MNRLETLAPDLAAKMRHVSLSKQRAACLAACEFAIATARVDHPLASEALRELRAGKVLTSQQKMELDVLTTQLDDQYFNLQEAADAGNADRVASLEVFAKARAVAALSFAGNDAAELTADAIYEAASAAGDHKRELLALILSKLDEDCFENAL